MNKISEFESQQKESRVKLMADIETYIQYLNDKNIREFSRSSEDGVVENFMTALVEWHDDLNGTCHALKMARADEAARG